jgi:hypothetical protein
VALKHGYAVILSRARPRNARKSAYEAWKFKDAKFWNTFLSDKLVGWGSLGRLDKAAATKEYTGADCEIKSYAANGSQRLSGAGRCVGRVAIDACGNKIT